MTSPAPAPTLREMVRSIVQQIFPRLPYKGLHTYTVSAVNFDGSINLSPPQGSTLLPALSSVRQWCGAGIEAAPAAGSPVVVAFLDDDPRTPALVAFAPLHLSTPTRVDIFAVADIRIGGSTATAVALAPLVAVEHGKILASITGILGLLNVVFPGLAGAIPPYVPGGVAAIKVKAV